MPRLTRGLLTVRAAGPFELFRVTLVVTLLVDAATAQEWDRYGSHRSARAPLPSPAVMEDTFTANDRSPPLFGDDITAEESSDAPSEPWLTEGDGAEEVGYDAATGAVSPEGGRLDAAPPFARPSLGRSSGGNPFAPKAEYRMTWFPDRPVVGQGTDLGVWRQDLSASFPIAPVASGLISGTVSVGHEDTVTDALLPDSGVPIPIELWSVSIGANCMRKFENGWAAGGGLSLGSASDEPFADIDVLQISANGFLRVPHGERNAWLFSLFYAPMSELPFPLPGVAYQWQPSDAFKANIGLPLSLTYTPTDRLSFEATYLPIRTVRTRASYAILDSLKAYAGYERSNRSWFLAERLREDDRLFYYDQRLASGLEWSITEQVTLDLSGGYAFDRFYLQGEDFDDRTRDRVDVEDGPFVAAQFQGRW